MSVSGISTSNPSVNNPDLITRLQQRRQEVQKLGQDLQGGDLSAAQADFANLEQLSPNANPTTRGNGPVGQAFNQLAQDLQTGNLAGAQQDFANVQQAFQQQQPPEHVHEHRHHEGGGGIGPINPVLAQLGQALQSGNLPAAQQAYTQLQQDFQQLTQNNGPAPSPQPVRTSVSA